MAGRRTPLSSYSNSPNPSSHEESFPSGSSSLSSRDRDGHARALLPRPRLEEPPQADAVRMNASRARVALPEWTRRAIRQQELRRRLAGPSSIAVLQQLTMLNELEGVEEASESEDEEAVSSQTPDSRSSSPDLRMLQRESRRNLHVSAETSSFSFARTDCSSFTSVTTEGQPQGLGLADLDNLPEDYIFYLWQLAGEILNNEEGKTSKQSQWQIHQLMTRCETAQDAFCHGGLNLYHDAKTAKAEFDAYVQSLRELEKFVAEELLRSHKVSRKKIRMNAMNFAQNTSRLEFESAARAQLFELQHAEERMMNYSERFHELKSLLPASRMNDENELSDSSL